MSDPMSPAPPAAATEIPRQSDLRALRDGVRAFVETRDWRQFHSPKNLAMALIVEAAELVEHFQWNTEQESRAPDARKRDEAALEMADILIYLVRIADELDVDLGEATWRKMAINEQRYPAVRVRGSARKYDEYDPPGGGSGQR